MPARKTKSWDFMGKLLTTDLPAKLVRKGHDTLMENAKLYQEAVVMLIEDPSLAGWPELSEEWFFRKMKMGAETDEFRFKDDFLNYMKSDHAIMYVKGRYANSKVFVGARSGVTHDRGYGEGQRVIDYETLLLVLQYDYNRPLFETAYLMVEEDIRKNWKHILEAFTSPLI